MRLRKINLSLASPDVFELDLVLEVDATDRGRRYLDFTEPSVKHLSSFNQ